MKTLDDILQRADESAGDGVIGHITDKTGEKHEVHHSVWDGKHRYAVKNADGHTVAHADLHRKKPVISSVTTLDHYRRRGIASKMYDHIEKHRNIKLEPNDALTDHGEALWKNRKKGDS